MGLNDGSKKNTGYGTVSATGKIEIRGFDWGPAITKAIIAFSENLDKNQTLTPDMFSAKEIKKSKGLKKSFERKITDVYFSDDKGNKAELTESDNKASYITLELYFSPIEGSPFYYDLRTFLNKWLKFYSIEINLKKDSSLVLYDGSKCITDKIIVSFENKPDSSVALFPEIEKVNTEGSFTGKEGHTFSYASFTPENASEENRRPLVIWVHGMGEGGTDPYITLYGNKVVPLFGDEFQNIMGGAYILTPQTPKIWKIDEKGKFITNKNPHDHSVYLHDLKDLIDDFVAKTYVDKNRIIVGGCSNGGFMTMDLILHYPDYFAAAYPICEILEPELISDERLNGIKNLPMWYIYAKNDMTVDPALFEEPLIKRLKEAGAADLHVNAFDDVHDTSGQFLTNGAPYQYYGHWSWIYFFNNECKDGDLSLWQWLSKQGKRQ